MTIGSKVGELTIYVKKLTSKSNTDSKSLMIKDQTKTRQIAPTYIGMDLHKNYLQIAVMDKDGNILHNSKVGNNAELIDGFFQSVDNNAKVVMESSNVWYNIYQRLQEKGLDVILSNPLKTKAIASAKIKTDKIDAKILADLLRGGFIAQCYVPPRHIMEFRIMVRYRHSPVNQRTILKNKIHGILLLNGIKMSGKPFSKAYNSKLHNLSDYRIDGYLRIIESLDSEINQITKQIESCVKDDESARLLTTIPGIGYYSALLIASEIGDINRFADSHHLCSYAGLVPSTHSSGGITHYGKITKTGSRHIRWVLTECIHTHVRCQKDSNITAMNNSSPAQTLYLCTGLSC
jgi:transposase